MVVDVYDRHRQDETTPRQTACAASSVSRSSGPMSVDPNRPETNGKKMSDAFIIDFSDATGMGANDFKHISRWTKSQLEDESNNRGVWYRSGSKNSEP